MLTTILATNFRCWFRNRYSGISSTEILSMEISVAAICCAFRMTPPPHMPTALNLWCRLSLASSPHSDERVRHWLHMLIMNNAVRGQLPLCKPASLRACKPASLQAFKRASLQACKPASEQSILTRRQKRPGHPARDDFVKSRDYTSEQLRSKAPDAERRQARTQARMQARMQARVHS